MSLESCGEWLHFVDVRPSVFTRAVNRFKVGIDLEKFMDLRKKSGLLILFKNKKGLRLRKERLAGVNCYRVRPRGAACRKTVFYIHGGGFVLGGGGYCISFANTIARETGCAVVAPDYRLAPEHPFPAALNDVYAAYRELLEQGRSPSDIIFYGDSAGGGLCLSLCLKLKDTGVPLPSAMVLLSPACNLTESGETHITKADKDPIFTKSLIGVRELYAPGQDYKDPYLSPVYGNFSGFPPMLIITGENEVLLSDSLTAGKKAYAEGVDVGVYVWKEMFHAFPLLAGFLPEGKEAMKKIAAYIKEKASPGRKAYAFRKPERS
jgi:acetyl esterase/lipase